MYKKYKLGLCKNGVPCSTPGINTSGKLDVRDGISSYEDVLVKEKVRRCWQKIEDEGQRMTRQEDDKNETAWRTIRVFVSSTFTDFHSEREMLVKKVFPALREWCEEQQLHLVECDLRWGVPKDSTTGATLIACMEEIDRGYHDNNGEPFFLTMLSERYGWIPDIDEIPEDIRMRYDWVPDVSVTHMEILHGAYRLSNPSAVFFLRDPDYVSCLPSSHVKRFVDTSPLSVYQLQTLKEKLLKKFPAQVIKYNCQVGGMDSSTGRDRVQIIGLEEFAEQTLTFLKSAIRRRYPYCETSATSMAEEEQETRLHQAMAESKAWIVIGRDRELTSLLDFSRGDTTSLQLWSSTGQSEKKTRQEEDNSQQSAVSSQQGLPSLLCVLGAAGMGKSAVMARTAKTLQQTSTHVLYHHVGCTVSSLSRDNITMRVVASLAAQLQDDESQSDTDVSPMERLRQVMKTYASTDRHAVLLIDGVDELTESSVNGDVSWLRNFVSENVRCIVSAKSSHLQVMAGLKHLDCHKVELAALAVDSCRLLAEHYFSIYNKRLDKEQLDHLIHHSGATTPMWLAVACEELRLFGDFATLTSHIASLPPELDGLLAKVLLRLLREDDTDLMRKLLCLLYCCPAGCPEEHIQSLLGDRQTAMPLLTWVTLRRFLKPFIRMTAHPATHTVRIQFFHDSMRQAVKKNILSDTLEEIQWHHLLGDFYEHRCENNAFLTEDLPYHLLAGGCTQRLLDFYRKDTRAVRVPIHFKRFYLNKLRCHETTFAQNAMTGIKPMSLCHFCARKTRVFGSTPWLAKDTCCVCGELTAARGMGKEAQLCRRHAPFTAPGVTRCGICGHNIMGDMARKMTNAILCNFCNMGLVWNKCCQLVTDSC